MARCKMNMLWYIHTLSLFFIPGIGTKPIPGTQTSSTPASYFEVGTFPQSRSSLDHVSLLSFSAYSTSIFVYFSGKWTIISPYRCKLKGRGNLQLAAEAEEVVLKFLRTLVFWLDVNYWELRLQGQFKPIRAGWITCLRTSSLPELQCLHSLGHWERPSMERQSFFPSSWCWYSWHTMCVAISLAFVFHFLMKHFM